MQCGMLAQAKDATRPSGGFGVGRLGLRYDAKARDTVWISKPWWGLHDILQMLALVFLLEDIAVGRKLHVQRSTSMPGINLVFARLVVWYQF